MTNNTIVTDEMLERAYDAIYPIIEVHPALTQDEYQRHCYGIARAALAAALGDVEPDVEVGAQIGIYPIHGEDGQLSEVEWEVRVPTHGFSGSEKSLYRAFRVALIAARAAAANVEGHHR